MPLCVYCQSAEGLTADHIPPKAIFSEPRPSNLITVPSCFPCNQGFQGDDDYFLNLCFEWKVSETPSGEAVSRKRLRDMRRPQAARKWKPFFKKLEPAEILSPSGLYLGKTFTMRVSKDRILNTINRTVRGLFYHVMKRPLPVDMPVRSMLYRDYAEACRSEPEALEFVKLLPRLPGQDIGKGTFDYRYFPIEDEQDTSVWFLGFFKQFAFVSVTGTERLDITEAGKNA